MKKKRIGIAAGIALTLLLSGVWIVTAVSGKREPVIEPSGSAAEETGETRQEKTDTKQEQTDSMESSSGAAVSVADIRKETESTRKMEDSEAEKTSSAVTISGEDIAEEDIIRPNEEETLPETTEAGTTQSETEKLSVAETATERAPETEETETQGAVIVIGGDYREESYSCGVEGHHCEGPETHAYISNLELAGCKYCGSHSCPSFYGTDEWGNAQYTPSLCPMYSVEKDPLNYCQTCGKPTGDGTNGTCVHYIQECDCPNCGKHVAAGACHSCE